MIIAQIATGLPPKVDGVGDYAANLAEFLQDYALQSHFVLPATEAQARFTRFPGRYLDSNSADSLESTLNDIGAERVVLHFSGYGYARWGLCWWLADGVDKWRSRKPNRRLLTVFHEVYATGSVWQKSFWTFPSQRGIAHKIAAASDAVITTSEDSKRRLIQLKPCCTIHVMPVFSNIGEMETSPALHERPATSVIFGAAGSRERVYNELGKRTSSLKALVGLLGVERFLDIGPATKVPSHLLGAKLEVLGTLDAGDVSAHFANARLGIVHYPLHVMTKSGIIAAYVAHGLLVTNCSASGLPSHGFVEGVQYLDLRRLPGSFTDAELIAKQGYEWYRGHTRSETARLLYQLLS